MRRWILGGMGVLCGMAAAVFMGHDARAFPRYSSDGDATYCAQSGCHGDFRASSYTSNTDGMDWGNLHNLHRFDMLGGDCEVCHTSPDFLPVNMASSDGGNGLSALGCMGCHGRNADSNPENPSFPNGLGAGLRQHHTDAGVKDCVMCHEDANPANYTPVGEHVLPAYYANPGTGHDDMPADPCNDDTSEDFAGIAEGLDNDGDGLYDDADSDCDPTPTVDRTWGRIKAWYR